MTPVFELNDLHVSLQSHHKEIELVRGVSFAVAPGECLGILGESGSGKSMSMKAAMGLLDHSFHVKGSAQFQGEELLGKSAEELRRLRGGKVGIILQNPMTCFDPLYRIGQQIAETFSAHNNWTAEEIHIRSLELLEKMRIRNPEEVLEKYPTLDGVFCTNADITEMYLNLEKSDEHDAPALVGVDATTKQQEAIRNGEEIGCVSQQPYAMGYQTIWAAVETTAPKKSVVIEKNVLSNPAWIDADCLDDPDYSGYLYTE